MKAITIWQPWASLLACGAKKYETRSWATSYRGPIAIHAALKNPATIKLPPEIWFAALKGLELQKGEELSNLPRGCIVATAELVGCHKVEEIPVEDDELLLGDFSPGRYAWEFRNMKLLPEPIPTKGYQRLWNCEHL